MFNRPALTLIEVVAALVLVATTATLVLTAQSRSLHQLRHLQESETAHRLAGELIAKWKLQRPQQSPMLEGRFEEATHWHWRRSVRPHDFRSGSLQEVTLTVQRSEPKESSPATIGTWIWLERTNVP
ncbi:MAG: hypothetical protein AABZ47_00565 [Planctomycetota bacterium]